MTDTGSVYTLHKIKDVKYSSLENTHWLESFVRCIQSSLCDSLSPSSNHSEKKLQMMDRCPDLSGKHSPICDVLVTSLSSWGTSDGGSLEDTCRPSLHWKPL